MTPLLHGNQVLTEMWKYELNSFIFKVDIRKGILDQRELFVLGLYSNYVNDMINFETVPWPYFTFQNLFSKRFSDLKLLFFSYLQPKHPQSLLKQKPVTHTILVTTAPSGVLTTATSPYTTASATSPVSFQ